MNSLLIFLSCYIFALRYAYGGCHTLACLEWTLTGDITEPGDPEYDAERMVYDITWNRFPTAIVNCQTQSDVRKTLEYVLDNDLDFVFRSGGHSAAGWSTCDGCILIDLRDLRSLELKEGPNPTVVIGPGIKLNELALGLETESTCGKKYWLPTGGQNIGMGGHVHGGGWGRGVRQYGLATDNLVKAKVYVVDEFGKVKLKVASENTNPDLFFCLRGTVAPACGVVVEYELRVFEQPPVFTRTSVIAFGFTADFFPKIDNFTILSLARSDDNRDIAINLIHLYQSSLYIVSISWTFHDGDVLALDSNYTANLFDYLDDIGGIVQSYSHEEGSYMYIRCVGDADDPALCTNPNILANVTTPREGIYGRGWLLDSVDEWETFANGPGYVALEDKILNDCPPTSRRCVWWLGLWGGKFGDVASNATAFAHRDTVLDFLVITQFNNASAAAAAQNAEWINDTFKVTLYDGGYTTNRGYVNYVAPEITDPNEYMEYYYGDNKDRLVEIKCTWDPTDIFTNPQTIPVDTC